MGNQVLNVWLTSTLPYLFEAAPEQAHKGGSVVRRGPDKGILPKHCVVAIS